MIDGEIGVSEMLKEIFYINDNEDLISSDDFKIENLEFLEVKNSAYKKMIEYLKNSNRFSMDVFLAINATLAYGHHPRELDLEMEKYIIKYIDSFIGGIDSLKELNKYLNKESAQDHESVIVNKISLNLIKNIINLNLYHSSLYKNIHFYGVQNLLLNLSKYAHEKFSNWFLTTNRNDLKVIYINATLNCISNIDSLSQINITSDIPFLRAFSKIIFYNIDMNFFQLPNISKYFYDLESNEENIYFILYYFSKISFDIKNQNTVNEVNNDIKKASKYLNYLNKEILREFLNYINTSVCYGLIDEIKNDNLRIELFIDLSENVKNKIELEKFIDNFTIEKANILGNILLILGEEYFREFLEKFDKLIQKIEEPYYAYKYHDKWNKEIVILAHYLRVIFIYFQAKDNNKYLQHKDQFLKAKKSFRHINDKNIEDVLRQIT